MIFGSVRKAKAWSTSSLSARKAIYVKMSDVVNNFALQIHTENNQQLRLYSKYDL